MNTKIMVCCHKETEVCKNDFYLPIQVGHAIANVELNMQKDDEVLGGECDNISDLNNIYCEMTAMYWAWKNIRKVYPDLEYIGLCHYRRYFFAKNHTVKCQLKYIEKKFKTLFKILFNIPCGLVSYDPSFYSDNLKSEELEESNSMLLEKIAGFDVVATTPSKTINSRIGDYFEIIGKEYIELMTEIVNRDYADYGKYYNKVILGNTLYAANMLIIKTELLDEYCSFVFGVLEKHIALTKKMGICSMPEKEKAYSRVSGYLAEILTCAYLHYCKEKYKFKTLDKCFIKNL